MAGRELSETERLKYFFDTQKTRYEKCLEPEMQCQDRPIRAHSIQNAQVLDLLASDGHLIMPRQSFSKDGPKIEFSRVGRNKASTFTGLCGDHDRKIFRPIDTQPIEIENLEQRFLWAYRSVTREFHAVLEGAMRIQASYNWKVATGLLPGDKPTEEGIVATVHMLKAWETWKYRYKHFDGAYLASNWKDLRHKFILLKDQSPVIAVSTLFSFPSKPETQDVLRCALNVFPISQNQTAVIFTCAKPDLKEVYRNLLPILKSSGERQLLEISKIIIENVENFVISPPHFEGWSDKKKKSIHTAFVSTLFAPQTFQDESALSLF